MAPRKPDPATLTRVDRLNALKAELAKAASLDPDRLTPSDTTRLEAAVWLSLSLENLRARVLRGDVVDVTAVERYVAAINALLPAAKHDLRVHFVDEPARCFV